MDRQEYDKKYMENTKLTGTGFNATMNLPCPACAAPGYMSYKMLEVEEAMKKDTKCTACGRSFRAIIESYGPGSKQIEMVQTGGDDLPDYLPRIRRV